MQTTKLHNDSGLKIKSLPDLSDALIQLRQVRNLEQSDMKMLIGMSQQQYQSIEAGSNTTINTLLRILDGLEVDLVLVPKNTGITGAQASAAGDTQYINAPGIPPATPLSKIALDFANLRDDEE